MRNAVQDGGTLTVAAPYDVAAGGGFQVGTMFLVALSAALNTQQVVGATGGVFTLAKADSQAWTVGAAIYWDNTNKVCTTTVGSNKKIGVATKAVANTAGLVTGDVLVYQT
jgi:predicted RecA/RadA family phage recombinase